MNRFILSPKPVVALPMPKPKTLWIDGVGSYAMCDSAEVTIGQAFPGNDVDLAIRGDISRKACVIRRLGEDHLIEPIQSTILDGHRLDRPTILRSGSLLRFSQRIELRYTKPTLLSGTARLELLSSHRWQPLVNAAILLGDTCIIGPKSDSHVICLPPRGTHWRGRFLWFRQDEDWVCKGIDCPGLSVNQVPQSAPFKIEPGQRIQCEGASWTLTNP